MSTNKNQHKCKYKVNNGALGGYYHLKTISTNHNFHRLIYNSNEKQGLDNGLSINHAVSDQLYIEPVYNNMKGSIKHFSIDQEFKHLLDINDNSCNPLEELEYSCHGLIKRWYELLNYRDHRVDIGNSFVIFKNEDFIANKLFNYIVKLQGKGYLQKYLKNIFKFRALIKELPFSIISAGENMSEDQDDQGTDGIISLRLEYKVYRHYKRSYVNRVNDKMIENIRGV